MYICTLTPMLKYYNPIQDNNFIYSIDRCRIGFQVNPMEKDRLSYMIEKSIHVYSSAPSFTPFRYKNLCQFKYDSDSVMTMGIGFNGRSEDTRTDGFKGFLDFNPNKIGDFDMFWKNYRYIRSCCKLFSVVRIDVAVDMPYKRENLILEKDKRRYRLDANSMSNKTEYLGERSNVGFVKLYNKTIESELDYDISRLEITCEPNATSYFKHLPKVYNIGMDNQMSFEFEALNDTDKFMLRTEWLLLINGLDNGLMEFKKMGRRKVEKLKPFLLPDKCLIVPSKKAVYEAIDKFRQDFV